jgi:hypothetical protein
MPEEDNQLARSSALRFSPLADDTGITQTYED